MKHHLMALITFLLLLYNLTAEANIPGAFASVSAQVKPCNRVKDFQCQEALAIQLLTIDKYAVRIVQFDYLNGEGAYAYDSNDRLTETEISVAGIVNETTNYTYDSNYNRLSEVTIKGGLTTVDKTYVYNTRGQVTDVTDNLDAANSATYAYDNNGNRISKQSQQATENYVYDVRDQLKEIKQGGSTIGQFLYDYQGLRVEKTTTTDSVTDTKKYVYDDQSVLMQTDGDGSTLSKYDYGSNQLLSLNNVTEGAQFYLFDALGSPVNLTTIDGTVQARYQYDAFGNARSQTGDSANAFGFTGHEKDEETGLYYFKARYYDPTLGQFLTQDAFEGFTDTPPSLHKYVYAYGNPTVYIDPDGLTAEQFESLMIASIESFRASANRTALGTAGELQHEKMLKANGEIIIKGPVTSPGQHNADIVSYDPETGKISFFDNKIQTLKATVSRANNLSTDEGRNKSINEAIGKLDELDISANERVKIRKALEAVALDPSKAIWAVANATPSELTEVDNKVKRISQKLVKSGVRIADVVDEKITLLSSEHSSSNGRRVLNKLGKAVPVAGHVVSATLAATRLNAAEREDAAYRQAMQELGIPSSHFEHHSVEREIAIIAGEEAGGEGGGLGGASAVAPFSAGCGLAAPLCIGVGALAGGFAGDTIGGKFAERAFDEAAQQIAPGEIERIKQQIREMRSQGTRITVEDPSGTGGL